ncbi:Fic family protein [Thalassococcus sp. S3]|uniref:Fic family protein n=1 Tax=Thalassococcus sp. S3 TaxID=2017482 RepID=UPI001024356C|nr:Fic family protein [Thalassococcus sp. S3]QBF30076.1 cell filamentation protein Fic [Thalassococcus sp. S3]
MIWNWQHEDWPNWRYDPKALEAMEQHFLLGAGRLSGAWQHLSKDDRDNVKVELLSEEAIKTSEIEGEYLDRASVQSSVRRQLGLKAQAKAGSAEAGIAELMVAVFDGFENDITHETLFVWHRMVCGAQRDLQNIGAYRTHTEAMQVVSGPFQKPKVHFEAPPSRQVDREMTRFLDWLNQSTLPALTKAGIAHLYFVSIHPFEDGNGRIARAISEHSLSRALGQPSLLAFARQIEKERKGYYDILERNNKSLNIDAWLAWFAKTALKAQDYSIALIGHVIAKTQMLDRLRGQLNDRQERALLRMFEAGPDGFVGGLSAKNYRAITGATVPTTTRDLNDLVAKGALHKTGARKATRYWLAA